jgi:hypothetical protein
MAEEAIFNLPPRKPEIDTRSVLVKVMVEKQTWDRFLSANLIFPVSILPYFVIILSSISGAVYM